MIEPYKDVAIIYGGSGRECAIAVRKEIERLHMHEHYPIRAHILADDYLSSANILEPIASAISTSSVCVVILTFDDVNETRVRQNVLIEIGMAMMVTSRERCYFLTNKYPLPNDFPSDLRDFANPNPFDPAKPQETAEKLCKQLLRDLNLKQNDKLLSSQSYQYNYLRTFSDIDKSIWKKPFDVQLPMILDCWTARIESLDFASERIMYFLERVNFFTVFAINDRYFEFLENLKVLLRPKETDYELYDVSFLNPVYNFVEAVIDYTIAKGRSVPSEDGTVQLNKAGLVKELERIVSKIDKVYATLDTNAYSWFIRVHLHHFRAIAFMKILYTKMSLGELVSPQDTLSCIEELKVTLDLAELYDVVSYRLWAGYLTYDLARACKHHAQVSAEATYVQEMDRFIEDAVEIRKGWLRLDEFPQAFASAMYREYFLAATFRYEEMLEQSSTSKERAEALLGLSALRSEIENYCQNTIFGRLYEMRDDIDTLITNAQDTIEQAGAEDTELA